MRDVAQFALTMVLAAALLGGCGGSQPLIGAPGVTPQSRVIVPGGIVHYGGPTPSYQVVYSFRGGSDGVNPRGGLIDVKGTLYGTTEAGGAHDAGTVFSVTPGGTENVVHDFGAAKDGTDPRAGLIEVAGTLYGTTSGGGSDSCYGSSYPNCGTVFSITPSGAENVLHSFAGYYKSDGSYPYAGLIDVNGTLYGTTEDGGANGVGTVFSVTPSGTEGVVSAFGGSANGAWPYASLTDVDGTLYGTTLIGGPVNAGVVFSVTPSGAEKVVYSFGHKPDAGGPEAGLIDVDGILYGTTIAGGARGDGAVFSVTPGGAEKVLHSFGRGTDGRFPVAGLIELKGTLYGTTAAGGVDSCGNFYGRSGCGTVFSITLAGKEKVLYRFKGGSDGKYPAAGLIDVKGALYGTTFAGGTSNSGTVFSLKP